MFLATIFFLWAETKSIISAVSNQGCQMAYFQTPSSILGKFWQVLQWKMLVYFKAIWSILRPSGIFFGHLVYWMEIWFIFSVLVCCTKKNLATLFRIPPKRGVEMKPNCKMGDRLASIREKYPKFANMYVAGRICRTGSLSSRSN
jgi:hypothetical protein